MRLKPIENQVVVVMGASSGIGCETALRFARGGAKVVVSARGEEGLRSLVDAIRADDREAVAVVADVSEFGRVEAVAEKAVEEYGRLDTWVHLAAIGLFAPFVPGTLSVAAASLRRGGKSRAWPGGIRTFLCSQAGFAWGPGLDSSS